MLSPLSRLIALGALMVSVAVPIFSQQTIPTTDGGTAGGPHSVCGYETFNDGGEREALARTAQNNPKFYQWMVDRSKGNAPRSLQSAGDDFYNTFAMRDRNTQDYVPVTAVLVFQGRRARIWLDTLDRKRVSASFITQLARGLDTLTPAGSRNPDKSIIDNDEDVFGQPPPNRAFGGSDPWVEDFLMTDIKDSYKGAAYVAGFFSPWDQTSNPGSNEMNVLYIDSHEGLQGGVADILNTMAHEYQHLIHYRQNDASETVFNEGCSEVASILNGYHDRSNSNYVKNVNIPMFKWNSEDANKVLVDYERAMSFVDYLREQAGESFLTALTRTKTSGMDRVADALSAIGDNRNWRDILANYVAANYLRNTFHQPYAYIYPLSNNAPTSHLAYTTTFPDSSSMFVDQYAAVYAVYNKAGAIKVRFHSSQPFRVMAMLYRGTAPVPVEVWQLENDQEYTIGDYGTYDKIVFGIANLSNNGQTIRWNISKLTLGVDAANSAGALAISDVTPNPASGPVAVAFHTPATGTVKAELYDMRGVLVRSIVREERLAAGDHTVNFSTDGLASGTYMLQLTQDSRSIIREVVVVH